jgi:hypothetical protein
MKVTDVLRLILQMLLMFDYNYVDFKHNINILSGGNDGNDVDQNTKKKSSIMNKIMSEMKDIFIFIYSKIMYIVMMFAAASVYPSLPFFGILAGILSIVKYMLFKFRNL